MKQLLTISFTLALTLICISYSNAVDNIPSCPDRMVLIPATTEYIGFTEKNDIHKCIMGECEIIKTENISHSPSVSVQITEPYCVDIYELTQKDYYAVTGENPSINDSCGDNCPVEGVNWNQANSYCNSIGKRLPTEAEWEIAAKGGMKNKYNWESEKPYDYAVYFPNSWDSDQAANIPFKVGTKLPNEYGLFDIFGNVNEWVYDCFDLHMYHNIQTGQISGINPVNNKIDCDIRVIKGGNYTSWDMQVYLRNYQNSSEGSQYTGFRCASSISDK